MLLGMDKTRDPFACDLVAELGGPTATARIFKIRVPSVSGWMENGIPRARQMYIELAYPEIWARLVKKHGAPVCLSGIDASDDTQPPVGTAQKRSKRARRRVKK